MSRAECRVHQCSCAVQAYVCVNTRLLAVVSMYIYRSSERTVQCSVHVLRMSAACSVMVMQDMQKRGR